VFGIVSILDPVLAAVSGLALLGQHLDSSQWIGLLVIVAVELVALASPADAAASGDEDGEMVLAPDRCPQGPRLRHPRLA
jgi:inner membrane transporter RhtA